MASVVSSDSERTTEESKVEVKLGRAANAQAHTRPKSEPSRLFS